MCVYVSYGTKSAVDEGFRNTCSVQLFLVLEHSLGMHFQPQLHTYTQTDMQTHRQLHMLHTYMCSLVSQIRCCLPGVAYPGVRDNRSTLNTKTGYDEGSTLHPSSSNGWAQPAHQFITGSTWFWTASVNLFSKTPLLTVTSNIQWGRTV